MAELKFFLDGKEVNPPLEWESIKILATWVHEGDMNGGFVQPSVLTDEFTFVNEAAETILNYIEAGKTSGPGIFRGIPFSIQATDVVDGSIDAFTGFLDFLDTYNVQRPYHVRTRIAKPDDLELLSKRLEALSYGYLKEKKVITARDFTKLQYVVQPIDRKQDYLWLAITGAWLTIEVAELIEEVAGLIVDIAAVVTTAQGILKLALKIIYLGVLIVALLKFLSELAKRIIPLPRPQNAMSLRALLEKAFTRIGFSLETNIDEMAKIHYMPSRQPYYHRRLNTSSTNPVAQYIKDGIEREGIPNLQDYGYRCSEMLKLVMDLFNAQVKVDGTKVYIYTESDTFWQRNSTYILPDILLENYSYNVNDAVAMKLLSFQTDTQDGWTTEDFTGTNYQVNLESNQAIPLAYNLLKSYKEMRWPVALASRKGLLDDLEQQLKFLSKIFDGFKNANAAFKKLKIKSPFAVLNPLANISIAMGLVRVENQHWSVPKLVYWSGSIPQNHRDKLSARALYTKFHSYRSFAAPYTGQRILYRNIQIPFGLADYLKVQRNSYFRTADGKAGKFLKLEWQLGRDMALVDFEIIEPYIKTLRETTFEP